MGRKIISVSLILLMFLVMPITALAQEFDPDRTGSISVTLVDPNDKTPLADVELSLYHVATVRLNDANRPSYTFTEAFVDCGTALDNPALTAVLDAYVRAEVIHKKTQATDTHGSVLFTDLPLGLYFIKQTNTVAGYAPCASFLVTVPNYTDDGYVYDINATPKTDISRLRSITIRKVWNTDASASAANSVTVQLLKDEAVIETAVLNDQNNWQVTYTDMPESDAYSIVEVDVPKGFVATYSRNGYIFTVTNTAYLIQTGHLTWPIPVLALAGILFLMIGFAILRKPRKQDA